MGNRTGYFMLYMRGHISCSYVPTLADSAMIRGGPFYVFSEESKSRLWLKLSSAPRAHLCGTRAALPIWINTRMQWMDSRESFFVHHILLVGVATTNIGNWQGRKGDFIMLELPVE